MMFWSRINQYRLIWYHGFIPLLVRRRMFRSTVLDRMGNVLTIMMMIVVNSQTQIYFGLIPAYLDFLFRRAFWSVLVYDNRVYDFIARTFFSGNIPFVTLNAASDLVSVIVILRSIFFVVIITVLARLVVKENTSSYLPCLACALCNKLLIGLRKIYLIGINFIWKLIGIQIA